MRFFVFLVAIALVNSATLLHPQGQSRSLLEGLRYFEDEGRTATAEEIFFLTKDPVLFYFFNRNNPEEGVQIRADQLDNIVELTGFDIEKPTLIIVHGWQNNISSNVNVLIKDEVLKSNDINVIVVDWGPIARKLYTVSYIAVRPVGNSIGDFLISLDEALGHCLTQVTIVGHSLGAHISGNAGARSKGLIDIIIGLDPARPLFSERKTDNRLDPTDARFVHVIHTNHFYGFNVKLGHVDFYPNGGKNQPGCGSDYSCSHSMAYRFYSESLYNNNFKGKLCDNWSDYEDGKCENNTIGYMGGFPVQTNVSGNYYLTTNEEPPYAQ